MKKTVYILYCLFFATVSFGQCWTKIDDTKISFVDFSAFKSINYVHYYQYDYFKKDSLIIGVSRNLKDEFLNLFKRAPNAFDSLIRHSYLFFNKSQEFYPVYDTALSLIDYKKGILFNQIKISRIKDGVEWTLKNVRFEGRHSCYNPVYFKRTKKRKNIALIFNSVGDYYCEI